MHPFSKNLLKSTGRLEFLTLAYLTVPVVIFLFGWLHLWIAIVASLGLLAAVMGSLRSLGPADTIASTRDRIIFSVTVLLFGLLWVGISGIGGVGYQNADYGKHNALLNDLSTMSWPLIYNTADLGHLGLPPVSALVYSVAYFLPGGMGGALGGWETANITSFVWGWLGMVLSICWFTRLAAIPPWIAGVVFPFLGGLDVLAYYCTKGAFPRLTDHIEWWLPLFQYSANSTLLMWVPQHAFAGWIGTGILVYLQRRRTLSPVTALTVITAVSYWSAFAALGLVVLLAPFALTTPLSNWRRLELIGPLALLVILAMFLTTNHNAMTRGFLWFFDRPHATAKWLFFCVMEFALALGLTWRLCGPDDKEDKKWLIWCGLLLTLLPLFKLGHWNDLVTRVSIPALVTLWALVWYHLYRSKQKFTSFTWLALVVVMSIGALSASTEIVRGVKSFHIGAPPQASLSRCPHSLDEPLVNQYFAAPDSPFFRYLARKATVQ